MSHPTIFGGFDMSLLIQGSPKTETTPTQVQVSEATKRKTKKDKINSLIASRMLDQHPEMLVGILKEYRLATFWKSLKSDNRYSVVEALAVNRMLNFFEAAYGILSYKEIQQGLLISALSAAPVCDRDNINLPTSGTYLPCFYSQGSVKLEEFKIKDMSDEAKAEVICILNRFSRRPLSNRAVDGVALLTYLKDAWKMWVCSKDDNLLDFMGRKGDRKALLSPRAKQHRPLTSVMGDYEAAVAADRHELTLFNTVWGRTKCMKYNIPMLVKKMTVSGLVS